MANSILIVDTDASFGQDLAKTLAKMGWKTAHTDSPVQMWQILAKDVFDVVTIDGLFPGTTPIDMVYKLLHFADSPLTVFVSHRKKDLATQERTAIELGVDYVVHKPDATADIAERIDAFYCSIRESQPPPEPGTSPSLRKSSPPPKKSVPPPKPTIPVQPPQTSIPTAPLDSGFFQRESKEEQLSQLRQEYGTKIPTFFSEIGQHLVAAQEEGNPMPPLEKAHRIAHSVNGTSGTLGFTEVGAVAGAAEDAIKKLMRIRRVTSMPPSQTAGPPISIEAAGPERVSITDPVRTGGRSILADILVLDDDPEFLSRVVTMGLENLIRVYPAKNGQEALRIADENKIDGAIIDVFLGNDEDAFEVAKKLRSRPKLTDLPISFISADTSIPTRIAATHAGATQFLDKPMATGDFVAAVRHLVPTERVDQPRILVVDDDPNFLQYVEGLLSDEKLTVSTLQNPTKILEEIEKFPPDLVLLDVVMPQVGGFDVCRVLRSTEKWSALPIIFLTGHPSFETRVSCFEAGGDDFIEKPIVREELLARINVRLERIKFFKDRADYDVLTGLPTRRTFIEMFKMRLAEGFRYKKPVSLVLIDLDYFKRVNDTYGHLAGDRVLSTLGKLLLSRFRTIDIRGRWGGEEFVLAFYGEDAETARMIIGRAQEEFNKITFRGDHGEKFRTKFSAGVATFPVDGQSFEELFRIVDIKLYAAKEKGRNRIEI